ncbi:hypothetical protein Phum_PHUM537760 [Pediculus humanus corporis]|uniref:Uncharacterized protein n=1 Tax=Pediculus humanus subsp. corporis TaxID=121224 RepID=E0VZS8_PEDHC|nr:uncharacterized protein Phum_PHUM537760 [Pediculus humanus corporis]EEB18884.1 hypothetical protein Phum_PHUM537760 [Pediculus humanus corporis]
MSVNASITRPIKDFETLLRAMSREVGLLKKGERHLFSSADISTWVDFIIHNSRGAKTCVRVNGESVIDLTISSATAASLGSGWEILSGLETLIDYVFAGWFSSGGGGCLQPWTAWRGVK